MWNSDQFCGEKLRAVVDTRLEALGGPSSIDQSTLMTFSGAPQQQRGTSPSSLHLFVEHGHTSTHACVAFAKVALSFFSLSCWDCKVLSLSDIDSGEAHEWEYQFRIVDGRWAWTRGALGLDDRSGRAVLTNLCFKSGLREGAIPSGSTRWLLGFLTAATVKGLPRAH